MDIAHKQTEKILSQIERRVRKEYRQASKEVEQKLDRYFAAFRRKDEAKRELVKSGELSEQDYKAWRTSQLAVGKRWENMKDQLAQDYTNATVIARNISDGYMPEVYAINHNFATYQVETSAKVNTSYTLYSQQSVERLMRENPDILPQVGRTTQELIDSGVLKKWEMKNIQSTMIQGILQGESINALAKRMAYDVGATNYKDCVKHARTMTTATQNAGRVDGYKRAEKMGIDMEQEWVAVLDGRTRHEHRQLDGQRRPVGEPFEVDGYKLDYPADPKAPYYLIMNCRCTLIGQLKGFERDTKEYRQDPELDGMSYDEWKQGKKKQPKKRTEQPEKAPKQSATVKTPSATPKSENKPEIHTDNMDDYNWVVNAAKSDKIDHNPVAMAEKQLTGDEIIAKIAGGDETKGSCASLSMVYAANKCGIDIEDFRGGRSQELFSRYSNIEKALKAANAEIVDTMVKKEASGAAEVIKQIAKDKEYILITGKHAAVIRKTDAGLQYLELQSNFDHRNGWQPFEKDAYQNTIMTLRRRFGCRKTEEKIGKAFGNPLTIEKHVRLIDVDTIQPTEEFKDILGYINTSTGKQKKGAKGGTK